MNASSDFLISDTPQALFGQHVCDLGWNAALGLVEGLASLRGNRTTLGFFDERSALRQALDPSYRERLGRRMLLPAGGRVLGLLERALRGRHAPVRFSAQAFVPALLTFLEKRRIGLAGEDASRLEALRLHFAVHAPWHDIVIVTPGQDGQHFDLVIVDAPGLAAEQRIERRLAAVRTGLVIMAGAGLSQFAHPEASAQVQHAAAPKPSFA
jgi:hypothetical protein